MGKQFVHVGEWRPPAWLTYLEEIKVIPVYGDAVTLMIDKPLVQPKKVVNILNFLKVVGSNY